MKPARPLTATTPPARARPPARGAAGFEVDLGKPLTVGRAVIKELGYHRTQRFAVEYKDGETWKPVVRGAVIGGEKAYSFPRP